MHAKSPVAFAAGISGLLSSVTAVLLALFLSGCAPKPPAGTVEQAVTQSVRVKAGMMNPFTSDAKVKSWKITNQYKRGDDLFYEFTAEAHLFAGMHGARSETDATITGTIAFQKAGDTWKSTLQD